MKDVIKLKTPLDDEDVVNLKAGDMINLTGYIYTGRDAAHKRLIDLIKEDKELPIELDGQVIYYVGPAPAKPDYAVGSAGPTTSYRMDPFTPTLLDRGLKAMIGKGTRSEEVVESIKKNNAVYFGAVGGAAALIARSIKEAEVVAYDDLGTEAIHKFYVEDFPLIVVIDSKGNDLYKTEPAKYEKHLERG